MANTDTKEFKSGLCGPDRASECRQIHADEPPDRTEDRDHIQKPQTTRNRIRTVYTDERGQIIFLDTPGIHKAKNKLGEYMVSMSQRIR